MLVVLERGARFPAWVDHHRTDEDTVVIARQSGEPARDLLERIRRSASDLALVGCCIKTAVFAFGADSSVEATSERAAVARALLPYVCARSGAFVMVVGDASSEQRHEVLALCGALTEGLRGTGIAILAVLATVPVEQDQRFDGWNRPRSLGVRLATASRAVSAASPRSR